ncbi:hypothetical protein ACFLSK_00585 [Chloroflexota bacterium]
MIIECPECGAKNQITQPTQLSKRYRSGKCGEVMTFLETVDVPSATTPTNIGRHSLTRLQCTPINGNFGSQLVPKTHELHLRIKDADEADFDKSLIRIHETNRPQGIEWSDYIDISLDKKKWITCKLESAGDIGIGNIYISIPQRSLLKTGTIRIPMVVVGEPCKFYVRKASKWRVLLYIAKALLYIAIVAIVIIVIVFLISSLAQ